MTDNTKDASNGTAEDLAARIAAVATKSVAASKVVPINAGIHISSPTSQVGSVIERADAFDITIADTIAEMRRSGCVFRRDRSLVVPDRSVVRNTRHGKKPLLGLVTLNRHSLLTQLTKHTKFLKVVDRKGGPEERPVLPSSELRNSLLTYHDAGRPMDLPPLQGVLCAPFMRQDGTVCEKPGYDEVSGIWFDPCGMAFPPMPHITPANAWQIAIAAAERLSRPLRGYRFDTSTWDDKINYWSQNDTGRATAISMFLTSLATNATRTRPGYLIDAAVYGSGKTMLTELPAIMTTGNDPSILPLAGIADGSADEFNKQLDTALLDGTGYIIGDNAKGDLALLGRLITLLSSTSIAVRLFGLQQKVDVLNNVVVLISGNNVEASEDMGRRFLRSRIDTGIENPDQKAFDFDPRDEVLAQRGQLCIDALTVMAAYRVAGAPPQQGRPYGSYEGWAKMVRDPLLWLGFPDIVSSNDEERAADPTTGQVREFIAAWAEAGLTGEFTVNDLVTLAMSAAPGGTANIGLDRLRGVLMAVAVDFKQRNSISEHRLGRWLSKHKGRRVDGHSIRRRVLVGVSRYSIAGP